jgi:hypothetical protein
MGAVVHPSNGANHQAEVWLAQASALSGASRCCRISDSHDASCLDVSGQARPGVGSTWSGRCFVKRLYIKSLFRICKAGFYTKWRKKQKPLR